MNGPDFSKMLWVSPWMIEGFDKSSCYSTCSCLWEVGAIICDSNYKGINAQFYNSALTLKYLRHTKTFKNVTHLNNHLDCFWACHFLPFLHAFITRIWLNPLSSIMRLLSSDFFSRLSSGLGYAHKSLPLLLFGSHSGLCNKAETRSVELPANSN